MNKNHNHNFTAQWGRTVEQGNESQQAFPFFYSIVAPQNEDPTNLDSLIGVTVPSQSKRSVPVILDTDYNFKLLWLRFSACTKYAGRYYEFDPLTQTLETNPMDIEQKFSGIPLLASIRATLTSVSNGATVIYGGQNADPLVYNQFPNITNMPLNLQSIQGYAYGIGQARVTHLMPAGGTVTLDFYNTHAYQDIIVSGILYGMKVRV